MAEGTRANLAPVILKVRVKPPVAILSLPIQVEESQLKYRYNFDTLRFVKIAVVSCSAE